MAQRRGLMDKEWSRPVKSLVQQNHSHIVRDCRSLCTEFNVLETFFSQYNLTSRQFRSLHSEQAIIDRRRPSRSTGPRTQQPVVIIIDDSETSSNEQQKDSNDSDDNTDSSTPTPNSMELEERIIFVQSNPLALLSSVILYDNTVETTDSMYMHSSMELCHRIELSLQSHLDDSCVK